MGQTTRARLLGAGTLVTAVLALEGATRLGWVNAFVVPAPSDILVSLPALADEGVAGRVLDTARELGIAMALITVLGIAAGAALNRYSVARRAFETWIAAAAAAPVVLLYPLFLVVFGRSTTAIVMLGVASGLPVMTVKALEGFSSIRPVLIDVGRGLRLSPWQMFVKIRGPATLSNLFTAVRLAMTFALITIIGAEYLINFGGLGQLIGELSEQYLLAETYGAIGIVVALSVALFWLTEGAGRWLNAL